MIQWTMKKDKTVRFRITAEEEKALKKAAEEEGFTVSQLIRFYLKKVLRFSK